MERIAVICFAAMALFGSVVAQTPAPSPSADCLSYITTLAPCLKFVTTPTNQSKPDKDCCTALSTVVSTKPSCLCLVLDPSNSLGLQINRTQALALPGACNVKTPSVSQCNAAGPTTSTAATPVSSPTAMSPAMSPAKSPASSLISPAKSPAVSPMMSPDTSPAISPASSPSFAMAPSPSPEASSAAPVSAPTAMVPSPAPATAGEATAPTPGPANAVPVAPSAEAHGMTPSTSPPSLPSAPTPTSPSLAPGAENTKNAGTTFSPSAIFVLVGLALATLQW